MQPYSTIINQRAIGPTHRLTISTACVRSFGKLTPKLELNQYANSRMLITR
jgi:hypothetical protein